MEKEKLDEFFSLIEKSESIVIFGHVYPDGDCYGSTEGLKYALKEMYPEKKVYVSKTDFKIIMDGFPSQDDVSDEVISNSLHIVLDLSDKKRVGDKRAFDLPNKGMIKVDHHYFTEEFGGLEIISTENASCADLLASILYSRVDHLPKIAANCFFLGITTDSGRFQYSCSKELLEVASKLVEDGADPSYIYSNLYVTDEQQLLFKGYLMTHYKKTFMGTAYVIVPFKDSSKMEVSPHGAALGVNTIGNIAASRLWAAFGVQEDGKVFAEFRSKGEIDVHQIAVEFGGGGHLNASGCTLASYKDIDKVISRCDEELLKSFGEFHDELKTLLDLGIEASKRIMKIYDSGFEIEIKEDNSPVTNADKASDKLIRDTLLSKYPSYGLLTEEDADDKVRLSKDKVFIIDPLDGTSDFVAKNGMFCVNLALVKDHHPVVGVVAVPKSGDVYFAVKGYGAFVVRKGKMIEKISVSRKYDNITLVESVSHQNPKLNKAIENHKDHIAEVKRVGSAIKACMIAEGKAEACYTIGRGTKEWDTCAPQLIVEEAKGIYHQNHGDPITYNRDDVYNEDGFTILNDEKSDYLKMKEIESE